MRSPNNKSIQKGCSLCPEMAVLTSQTNLLAMSALKRQMPLLLLALQSQGRSAAGVSKQGAAVAANEASGSDLFCNYLSGLLVGVYLIYAAEILQDC